MQVIINGGSIRQQKKSSNTRPVCFGFINFETPTQYLIVAVKTFHLVFVFLLIL